MQMEASVNEFTLYYLLSCCVHISLVRLRHHVLGTWESRALGTSYSLPFSQMTHVRLLS